MGTLTISSKQIGQFDRANRYYVKQDYVTESINNLRAPSRGYPYAQYKHIFTKKYAKQLAEKLGYDLVTIIK